jgi:hypothetical protein
MQQIWAMFHLRPEVMSLTAFSQEQKFLNWITWRFVPNFTRLGQEIRKVRSENNLRPLATYDCHRTDSHKNNACSTFFFK